MSEQDRFVPGVPRATEPGGAVLAGPFDAPRMRLAALQDPQGATVSSQLVPTR